MCGIIGVAFCGDLDQQKEIERQQVAWYLATELLLATQARGEDATGIATVFNDGNYIGLKMGVTATEFVASTESKEANYHGFFKIWKKAINNVAKPRNAKLFMGHCRKTTLGSVWDNNNNHPLHVEPIIGIHNGGITNHELIFNNLKKKRIGNVDSEAIFQLIHNFTDEGKLPITDKVLFEVTKRLSGTYAVIASNTNDPYKVAVFRDGRPAVFNIIKPLNMIVISSEPEIFQVAIFRYNKEARFYNSLYNSEREWKPITKDDVETVILKDDHFSILNLTDPLPEKLVAADFIKQIAIPRNDKMWLKEATPVASYNTGYNQKKPTTPLTTPLTTKPTETVKSADKSEELLGYLWVEEVAKYEELTTVDILNLEKLGCIELETVEKVKEEHNKEAPTVEVRQKFAVIQVESDEDEPSGGVNNPVIDATEEVSIRKRTVIMDQNPICIKKAAMYANGIQKIETDKELAEVLELTSIKEIDSLPVIPLVNSARSKMAEKAYYDALVASFKESKEREVFTASAKNIINIITASAQEYEENLTDKKYIGTIKNFILKKMSESQDKVYIEDLKGLFESTETADNKLLKEICTELPSRIEELGAHES